MSGTWVGILLRKDLAIITIIFYDDELCCVLHDNYNYNGRPKTNCEQLTGQTVRLGTLAITLHAHVQLLIRFLFHVCFEHKRINDCFE